MAHDGASGELLDPCVGVGQQRLVIRRAHGSIRLDRVVGYSGEEPAASFRIAGRSGRLDGARRTLAKECDEGGPLRWHALAVTEDRPRRRPHTSCCTLGWISVASASTSA